MVKMQQHFGAKISTNINEEITLSYVVFLKKMVDKYLKISLFNKIKVTINNDIWTNENIDYFVVLLNYKQKKLIEKEPIVSFIGEMTIDFEKLQKLMKGEGLN
jgi:hypothetical protein